MARVAMKRELMACARRYGWPGKSFRTAKQFARSLRRSEHPPRTLMQLLSALTAVRRVPDRRNTR